MPLLTENQLTDIVDMIVDDYGSRLTGSDVQRFKHRQPSRSTFLAPRNPALPKTDVTPTVHNQLPELFITTK
jgi:hypothetical protein